MLGGVFELESPLSGGDLGVGKSVTCPHVTCRQIRKIFTGFHDPCPRENGERNPPLTPPKRGIVESPPKRGIIHATL